MEVATEYRKPISLTTFLYKQISIYNLFLPKENTTRGDEIRINEAAISCLCHVLLKINSHASCVHSGFHLM